ncbi:hypothetical protein F8568_036960 [Actinomadura sp. LD22]|uniref:Uncharacterized protein n=1 Tax=Actinomadura physcomitrii TaxID=2650748 RepID=A0A6I4MJ60_9ACTN|nr:hypothetical protein [Actinomadura physcomitrii]MWA05852.1 hypothetical protein [Actinomadura physcomitrii]
MRAGAFAAVCVVVSQVGHDMFAERPAPFWAGCAALAGVGGVGYCLADRRRPAWWILLAVEVVQFALHSWFSFCASPASEPWPPAAGTHGAGAHMAGMQAAQVGDAGVSHGACMSVGMLAAHALAGAVAAGWLYAGERALWRALMVIADFLVERALQVLVLLLGHVVAPVVGPLAVATGRGEDEPPPETTALRHVLVRRGPPSPPRALARV